MRISDWRSDVCSSDLFPSQTFPNAYGIVSVMQGRTENLPGPRDDFDSTVFDAGIGYLQPITTHMLLRAEARYRTDDKGSRSEEHTSELQSLMRISYAVFCLKKKQTLHQTLP